MAQLDTKHAPQSPSPQTDLANVDLNTGGLGASKFSPQQQLLMAMGIVASLAHKFWAQQGLAVPEGGTPTGALGTAAERQIGLAAVRGAAQQYWTQHGLPVAEGRTPSASVA